MSTKIRPLSECDRFIPGQVIAYWWDYEYHMAKYLFAAQYVMGKEVLDIGCGVGYGSSYFLRHGAKSVKGIEITPEVSELAKVHYERPGLEFINCDAEHLPFADNSFDVVCSIGMLDHVEDPKAIFIEIRRVLRPGGYVVCSVNNKDFIGLPFFKTRLDPFHKREFTPGELHDLSSECFSDILLYGEKLSKLWFQITCLSSVVSRKSKFISKITQRAGRMVFKQKLKPLIYTEERVDVDFPFGSRYTKFNLKEQSHFSSFAIVGIKDRTK